MTNQLTYGLTHLALLVKDIKASIAFYDAVFGARVMYLKDDSAQIQTVGTNDIIVFEKGMEKSSDLGKTGSILHFGFRLKRPDDIELVISRVINAGGIIIESGEFCPGEPYVYFKDLNGYQIEVWYELEVS